MNKSNTDNNNNTQKTEQRSFRKRDKQLRKRVSNIEKKEKKCEKRSYEQIYRQDKAVIDAERWFSALSDPSTTIVRGIATGFIPTGVAQIKGSATLVIPAGGLVQFAFCPSTVLGSTATGNPVFVYAALTTLATNIQSITGLSSAALGSVAGGFSPNSALGLNPSDGFRVTGCECRMMPTGALLTQSGFTTIGMYPDAPDIWSAGTLSYNDLVNAAAVDQQNNLRTIKMSWFPTSEASTDLRDFDPNYGNPSNDLNDFGPVYIGVIAGNPGSSYQVNIVQNIEYVPNADYQMLIPKSVPTFRYDSLEEINRILLSDVKRFQRLFGPAQPLQLSVGLNAGGGGSGGGSLGLKRKNEVDYPIYVDKITKPKIDLLEESKSSDTSVTEVIGYDVVEAIVGGEFVQQKSSRQHMKNHPSNQTASATRKQLEQNKYRP